MINIICFRQIANPAERISELSLRLETERTGIGVAAVHVKSAVFRYAAAAADPHIQRTGDQKIDLEFPRGTVIPLTPQLITSQVSSRSVHRTSAGYLSPK